MFTRNGRRDVEVGLVLGPSGFVFGLFHVAVSVCIGWVARALQLLAIKEIVVLKLSFWLQISGVEEILCCLVLLLILEG